MKKKKNIVVIVAGGKGLRMGNEIPKQFLEISGKPILMRTIDAFEHWGKADELILVLPENQIPYWNELCSKYNFSNEKLHVVCGGKTRFHSVKNALDTLVGDGIVAVHDGVRPFASVELIERCFENCSNKNGVIPAISVTDSLRKIAGNESCAVNRADYRAVQTPQVFDLSTLKNAYEKNIDKADFFTDDASVAESVGCKIKLVEGEKENIKITTSIDLVIAETFLGKR